MTEHTIDEPQSFVTEKLVEMFDNYYPMADSYKKRSRDDMNRKVVRVINSSNNSRAKTVDLDGKTKLNTNFVEEPLEREIKEYFNLPDSVAGTGMSRRGGGGRNDRDEEEERRRRRSRAGDKTSMRGDIVSSQIGPLNGSFDTISDTVEGVIIENYGFDGYRTEEPAEDFGLRNSVQFEITSEPNETRVGVGEEDDGVFIEIVEVREEVRDKLKNSFHGQSGGKSMELMGTNNDGSITMMPPFTKEEAEYEQHHPHDYHCEGCVHFVEGGGCTLVQGEIDPRAHCERFFADVGMFGNSYSGDILNLKLWGEEYGFDMQQIERFANMIEEGMKRRG